MWREDGTASLYLKHQPTHLASPSSVPTHGEEVAAENRQDATPEKQWHEAGIEPTTRCPLRSPEVGWNTFNGWSVINTHANKQSTGINQAWHGHFIQSYTKTSHCSCKVSWSKGSMNLKPYYIRKKCFLLLERSALVSLLPSLTNRFQLNAGAYLASWAKVSLNTAFVLDVYIFNCKNSQSMFEGDTLLLFFFFLEI